MTRHTIDSQLEAEAGMFGTRERCASRHRRVRGPVDGGPLFWQSQIGDGEPQAVDERLVVADEHEGAAVVLQLRIEYH